MLQLDFLIRKVIVLHLDFQKAFILIRWAINPTIPQKRPSISFGIYFAFSKVYVIGEQNLSIELTCSWPKIRPRSFLPVHVLEPLHEIIIILQAHRRFQTSPCVAHVQSHLVRAKDLIVWHVGVHFNQASLWRREYLVQDACDDLPALVADSKRTVARVNGAEPCGKDAEILDRFRSGEADYGWVDGQLFLLEKLHGNDCSASKSMSREQPCHVHLKIFCNIVSTCDVHHISENMSRCFNELVRVGARFSYEHPLQ
jgi:hypothetical protein